MELDSTHISCGVDQLHDLGYAPQSILASFAEQVLEPWRRNGTPPAFVLFSDAVTLGNGTKLAAYLRKHKLGTVYTTQPKMNKNSGNKIQVWTWSPDMEAVYKHTGVKPEEEDDY